MTKHWAADAFGPDSDDAPTLADSLADEVLRLRYAIKDALAVLDNRAADHVLMRAKRAGDILRAAVADRPAGS